MVYLLETAKDRLARDLPGYRIQEVDSFLDGILAALHHGEQPSPADVRAVTFPLTKWRTGYALRKLVDRIRNSRSGTTRRGGYAEEEVDEFLDQITHNLIRGERGTLQRLAGEARFTTVKLRPGYVMADVDSLLASVEQALADLAS